MTEKQKQQILEYLKFVLPSLENTDKQKGYLWINNPKNDFNMQTYFNTYVEGLALIEKYRHNQCYVGLSTTNDKRNWNADNLVNRYVILIDIDEENLDIKDVYNRCKSVGIFGHMVCHTGRGWHIYLKLDKKYNIDDIVRINKQLVMLFNADDNACKLTQVARVPHTKNFKTDTYSSMVQCNNQVKPYSLQKLKNHKPIEFKNADTELEFETISDLYCFSQLVKNGASKGFRNKSVLFISSTCKYADLSQKKALQYALEFNDNCEEPQKVSEVQKTVESIYNNTSLVKPCATEFGQKLCSIQCKCKVITADDILTTTNPNIDNKTFGLTQKHIISKTKNKEGAKKHMLEVLTGTELTIIAMLKVCNDRLFTKEDIVKFIEVSEPTVRKSLKNLEDKDIIISTKQHINKADKPTNLYGYNFEFEKYNKEIVHMNTNLFTAKLQKSIKDNDLKVAIALRYLMSTNQNVSYETIGYLSGVDSKNINKHIKSLEKAKLIIVDKVKTGTGKCNIYQLLY